MVQTFARYKKEQKGENLYNYEYYPNLLLLTIKVEAFTD